MHNFKTQNTNGVVTQIIEKQVDKLLSVIHDMTTKELKYQKQIKDLTLKLESANIEVGELRALLVESQKEIGNLM